MWSIQNILLLVTGLINLAMSIFIISRGWKNKVNLYFSLLTFFNFLWSISIIQASILNNGGEFWALFAHTAAMGIVLFLFYFSLHFPYYSFKLNSTYNYIIYIIAIIMSASFFKDKTMVLDYVQNVNSASYYLNYNKPAYILYMAFFFLLIITSVIILLHKYKTSEGIFKFRIKLVIISTSFGLSMGSFFDLILCYNSNFSYIWIGPLSTLLLNIVVFYLIKSPKKVT